MGAQTFQKHVDGLTVPYAVKVEHCRRLQVRVARPSPAVRER